MKMTNYRILISVISILSLTSCDNNDPESHTLPKLKNGNKLVEMREFETLPSCIEYAEMGQKQPNVSEVVVGAKVEGLYTALMTMNNGNLRSQVCDGAESPVQYAEIEKEKN